MWPKPHFTLVQKILKLRKRVGEDANALFVFGPFVERDLDVVLILAEYAREHYEVVVEIVYQPNFSLVFWVEQVEPRGWLFHVFRVIGDAVRLDRKGDTDTVRRL